MTRDSLRMEALESKLAFQEDALQQLSDALIAQQARIDRLQAQLALLAEQLAAGTDDSEEDDAPPPHY